VPRRSTDGPCRPAPDAELIIDPWKAASTARVSSIGQGPFRLLCRQGRQPHLRPQRRAGSASAGELRFVFKRCQDFVPLVSRHPRYRQPHRLRGIAAWANGWISLSQLAFRKTYNEKLESLQHSIQTRQRRQG
jgi:hypothetical protein